MKSGGINSGPKSSPFDGLKVRTSDGKTHIESTFNTSHAKISPFVQRRTFLDKLVGLFTDIWQKTKSFVTGSKSKTLDLDPIDNETANLNKKIDAQIYRKITNLDPSTDIRHISESPPAHSMTWATLLVVPEPHHHQQINKLLVLRLRKDTRIPKKLL